MANFVLIENNEIIEYHDLLPRTWKHISGLHLAKDDEEFLNSLGWHTVTKVDVFYDNTKQYISHYEYKFENNLVYETPILKDSDPYIPPPEKTPEELFEIALNEVRDKRNQLLIESDWTQLADVQQSSSTEWKTAWTNYRQELRDLPNKCVSGEINIYEIIWPIKPDNIPMNIIEQQTSEETQITDQPQESTPPSTTDEPTVGE